LSARFVTLGDLLVLNNDATNASNAYSAALAFIRMEKSAPTGATATDQSKELAEWTIDQRLALVEHLQGQYENAFQRVATLANLIRQAAAAHAITPGEAAPYIADLAYHALFVGEFSIALSAADEANGISPEPSWLELKAHALMFLGQVDDARKLYLANQQETVDLSYRGQPTSKVPYDQVVLSDFTDLRKAGQDNPLMAEVTRLLDFGIRH
jgi:hypothetical protein